ncbi:glycosyltransferase [Agarivorans sp. Alg241-V36]|uniref:glycosyltransferase n=1 Tax=Agarivorans sp. Alg241-V36 TaxID=2305992 RepID=UPI0013D6735E|nr:glycosyltransferase [Agarivorans sp. Alg241-V36]
MGIFELSLRASETTKHGLIIVPTDALGGAESNLMKVATELKRRRWNLCIIFLSRGDNGKWDQFDVSEKHYVASNRELYGFIKSVLWLAKKRLSGQRFDLSFTSHVHTNAFVGLCTLLGCLAVKRRVYRESSKPFDRYTGLRIFAFKLMYRLYRAPDLLVLQTQDMKEQLMKRVPFTRARRLKVIPNPVEYESLLKRSKQSADVKYPLHENQNTVELVSVGRLVDAKAFDVLLYAFKQLLDSSTHQRYRLNIVGKGPNYDSLVCIAEELGISNKVCFHGHIANPLPLMREADLCVVSSRVEGFPNALLEMMTVSKAVVSTTCADGVSSLPGISVCDTESAKQLSNAMVQELSVCSSERRKKIILMRKHVKTRTVEGFVNSLLETTDEAINY